MYKQIKKRVSIRSKIVFPHTFSSFLHRVVKWSKHCIQELRLKIKKYRVSRVNFIETQRYFIRPLPVHCLKTSINENAIHFTCTHCLEPRVSGRSIECACTRSPAFPSLSTYQRNQKVLRHRLCREGILYCIQISQGNVDESEPLTHLRHHISPGGELIC